MKKIRYISLLLIVLVFTMTLQAQPQIKFDSVIYDFGTFKEEDGVKNAIFNFTNTGTEPLTITNVRAS